MQDANWKDWFKAQHERRYASRAETFEQYADAVLTEFHDDFANPTPMGSLGDGGCDGIADSRTPDIAAG